MARKPVAPTNADLDTASKRAFIRAGGKETPQAIKDLKALVKEVRAKTAQRSALRRGEVAEESQGTGGRSSRRRSTSRRKGA